MWHSKSAFLTLAYMRGYICVALAELTYLVYPTLGHLRSGHIKSPLQPYTSQDGGEVIHS